ncbi:uncharacterized protein LOC136091115 [Hydra vulgaris]|uniref:Uncharacterized protein LOC136091115 n=1 Tax=Hydra vulgaris TaxID=6087 RepID=A0ABM4DI44_HYDVU
MPAKQTNNLSKALQRQDISAAEGQNLASQVVNVLEKSGCSKIYELFWERSMKWKIQLGVADPKLQRKRKMPDYLQKTLNPQKTYHYYDSPKERYRQLYFECFDLSIKNESWENHLQSVCRFYNQDINQSLAKTHIALLPSIVKSLEYDTKKFTIQDLILFLKTLNHSEKALLTDVVKIAKLILVMPASNSLSERSFSALKRVKTYLRSTITDFRLNNLLVLHTHKEAVDKTDLAKIANEFINKCQTRINLFGQYR